MTLPDRPVIRSELDPDPLTAFEEERGWHACTGPDCLHPIHIEFAERLHEHSHRSHLGAIVVVSAVLVLSVIAVVLLLGMGR